ncbi:MAG: phosphate acyltransferase PlsX [Alphaproteobacteria bacterium]|nr:phosphate acyltransferase PlsX [Alphaproteobacteria bacterium]
MGGDNAPDAIVAGALAVSKRTSLLLVGQEERVRPLLGGQEIPLLHAPEVVTMDDPATAPLRSKRASSMRVAMERLAAGEASAMVTCGHSGAALATAVHVLGCMPGVDRPALVTVVPRADGGEAVLLDLGANVDCKATMIAQFALMGEAYARAVLGQEAPRVGLLSNGEERSKGNALVREALPLVDALPIRFHGPVEPTDALRGVVDVLVCDGFVGNVMLKTVEATVDVTLSLLAREIALHPTERLGAWSLKAPLRRFRGRTSASAYGGALLLGVNGVVVVGHGRSDASAVASAIRVARRCVQGGVVDAVGQAMAALGGTS